VFRFPPGRNLFCALVGTGTQLFWLSIYIFALSCVGAFAPYSRGSMYTALIVLYALTAGIAGYTAGSYYKQMGGTAWVRGRRRRRPAGPAVHACRLAEARARARAGAQHAADMHRVLRPVLRRLLRQQHHRDRIRGAPRRRPPPCTPARAWCSCQPVRARAVDRGVPLWHDRHHRGHLVRLLPR